jgi:hypothetical protein
MFAVIAGTGEARTVGDSEGFQSRIRHAGAVQPEPAINARVALESTVSDPRWLPYAVLLRDAGRQ